MTGLCLGFTDICLCFTDVCLQYLQDNQAHLQVFSVLNHLPESLPIQRVGHSSISCHPNQTLLTRYCLLCVNTCATYLF